jgi:hypothetical protein
MNPVPLSFYYQISIILSRHIQVSKIHETLIHNEANGTGHLSFLKPLNLFRQRNDSWSSARWRMVLQKFRAADGTLARPPATPRVEMGIEGRTKISR